ncbi:pyruvate kinase [candidate division KSB1 bacterium]|nr:pyruvate kinase [candidate division KSB1 bacterium]
MKKSDKQYKRTRIVATLGPASRGQKTIERLIQAGADVFRLNFSHGTTAEHRETLAEIKAAAQKTESFPGVLADLQGPKIRTGRTINDRQVTLQAGSLVILTARRQACTDTIIHIDHDAFVSALRKGDKVLLNDGAVALKVVKTDGRKGIVQAEVLNTGTYASRKGVNVPGLKLPIRSLTAKDLRDLQFILGTDIPIIALSFVRSADDIVTVRRRIKKAQKAVKIVAKIEKPEAVDHIDEILDAADGIMIARGDLGIEMSLQQLPVIQKDLINAANRKEKLVIVATQMLESMISNRLPTRAECADVANAILDGTDSLMLSGETAVGKYPVETVRMMSRITVSTEGSGYYPSLPQDRTTHELPMVHALCEAAAWASRDMKDVPLVVFTVSGDTALMLSKIRYFAPIYAFTPSERTAAMLSLVWNTRAFVLPFNPDYPVLEKEALRIVSEKKLIQRNDPLLILSGTTPVRGGTNLLRILRMGEI